MSSAGGLPERGARAPDERLARLEAKLSEVVERLSRLEARLESLDEGSGPAPAAEVAAPAVFPARVSGDSFTPAALLAIAGRSLLVLGGAYLIRAVTESGAVPALAGVAAGLVYAGVFLALAVRSGSAVPASAHGVTAALVAFPLLWEAVSRFHVLGARAAAAALVGATLVFFACAARARLLAVAWAAALGSLGAAFALLSATLAIQTFSAALFAIAAATIGLEIASGWGGPRWPAALAADLIVLALLTVFARPGGPPAEYGALTAWRVEAFALGLGAVYLAAAALRSFWKRREPGAFEMVQVPAALGIALFAAVQALRAAELSPTPAGIAALAAGTAAYVLAREAGRHALPGAGTFFEWIGLALLLAGAPLAFGPDGAALLWCVLALALIAFPIGRAPTVHAALYLAAAALASGLAAGALFAFSARPPGLRATVVAVLGAAALCDWLARRPLRAGAAEHAVRVTFASVWLVCLGAIVMEAAARLLGDGAAALSACGTAVLALSAIALAAAARTPVFSELRALVYPVLIAGAVKLVVVDLRAGSRLTLVATFALFGAALIAAPRLLKPETQRG